MKEQEESWRERYHSRYPILTVSLNLDEAAKGNVTVVSEDVEHFISQEKEKSFKAGLERAVGYVEKHWDITNAPDTVYWKEVLEEARELKEGEV